jgi:mannose-6-phosphate isomerase-like protein (cupin superfamily)
VTPGLRRVGVDEGRPLRGGTHVLKAGVAETAGALTVWVSRTPFGKGPPLHLHEREDELFYVLAGRYEMVCGEARTVAEPGALLFLPRLTPHAFRSVSREVEGRLLHCCVPGGFEEYLSSISDTDAATEEGKAVRRISGERYGLRFPGDPRERAAGAERQPPFRIRAENGAAELHGAAFRVVPRLAPDDCAGRVAVEELHVPPGARWEIAPGARRAVAFLREGELELAGDGDRSLVAGETLILGPEVGCAGTNPRARRARWTVLSTPA